MFKTNLLKELEKLYLANNPTLGMADSYDLYKHKNGLNTAKSYSDAVNSLYAASKKNSSTYGANNRILNNKGLQNSGYSELLDDTAENSFKYGVVSLKDTYANEESKNRLSYASYLEKYKDKNQSIKDSVMSHLVSNDIVDLTTAVAYGMNAGLSYDDAKAIGQSAYQITKQKIMNDILKQTASLGLDREGAKMLAINMGLGASDAEEIAKEVGEFLKHYGSISKDYLEFLEQRSH